MGGDTHRLPFVRGPILSHSPGTVTGVCIDCPTRRDGAKTLIHEVVASLLLPMVLYAIPVGMLVVAGYLGA